MWEYDINFILSAFFLTVEIGLTRSAYVGSEANQTTEEICAALLVNPADLASDLATFLQLFGIQDLPALITPTQINAGNASAATGKYFYGTTFCTIFVH